MRSDKPKGIAMVVHWVDRVVFHIEEKITALSVIAMALILIANVLARQFHYSMLFTEEFSQFLLFFVTFLGTSYAARSGMHINMTMLSDALRGRARKALALVVSLVTAAVMFYAAYLSLRYVIRIAGFNRVSPILQVPVQYIWIVMPVGLFLTGIQYLLALIKNITTPGVWLSYTVPAEPRNDSTDSSFKGLAPSGKPKGEHRPCST